MRRFAWIAVAWALAINVAADASPAQPVPRLAGAERVVATEGAGSPASRANVMQRRDSEHLRRSARLIGERSHFANTSPSAPVSRGASASEPASTAATSVPATTTSAPASQPKPWFDPDKRWMAVMAAVLCGSVLLLVQLARMGKPMWVRPIAALQAVDEAVGRATEMGRPCLFVAGIQDVDDMGTLAGVAVLGRIARTVAEYGADLEVPTSRGLVMTACREAVQSAYYAAGRPDAYNPDKITYITDEQFGFVAYLIGSMVRRKPAACFYMGTFFAESLLLAETGHSIGAIQIAGTRETSQLPFFVAACDYTLIGEEFFAASAYLSGQPDQLGSLKGQDLGKLILGGIIVVGCVLATIAAFTAEESSLRGAVDYLQNVILR